MKSPREVILVTGSAGFIGSAVVKRFAGDYDVVGLDRAGGPPTPPVADVIDADLASDASLQRAFAQVRRQHGDRIASVIHLAAYYDFSGEPSDLYDKITVRGTGRLLASLRQFEVEQFVFSSTMLVHAPCEPGQRINEDWPLDAKWDYPKSKIRTEELIRNTRGAMPCVLLRIAGVYDDGCHSIPLANQIQRINERWLTSQVYPGDINRGQAFLHLDDLVDVLWRLVQRRGQLPEELPLLIGEPETLSYGELQREFGRLLHDEPWPTRQIPKAVAKTGAWLQDNMPFAEDPFIKPWMVDLADDHYELDITRARTLLDWEPQRSLGATLPVMVHHLQADPAGWYAQNNLKAPAELHPA